jgi:hypothetical protein
MLGSTLFEWNARALWVGCGLCAAVGALLLIPATRVEHPASRQSISP